MSKNKRRFEEVFGEAAGGENRSLEFYLVLSGLLAAFASRGLDDDKIDQLIKQAERVLEKAHE